MAYDLTLQKRLAATVLKVGQNKIRFDPARLNDVKQAITKMDIRQLVEEGAISALPEQGISRVRARKQAVQKSKGLRKGPGSRKGRATARTPSKDAWMAKVRAQRTFLKALKESNIVTTQGFRELYRKSKGGFFRSIRHIKLYMNERGIAQEKKNE